MDAQLNSTQSGSRR